MIEDEFPKTNINYIIDISMISKQFFKDYFQIKELISEYLLCLLVKSIDQHAANLDDPILSLFQLEDEKHDNLFQDLLYKRTTEELIVNDMYANLANSQQFSNLADHVFDVIATNMYNIVGRVKYSYERYLQHQIVMGIYLLNQHTLIVSFKTVRKSYV